jgi:uncharacterized protein (DUF488 family)
MLERAGVQTLVDVRRYPGSRRNPQYNRGALERALAESGIAYRHAEALGGRLSGEPGQDRFACIRQPAFRSYAARMGTDEMARRARLDPRGAGALRHVRRDAVDEVSPRFIADLLVARSHEVLHLSPEGVEPHRLPEEAKVLDGRLYLCGELVA